MVPVHVYDLLTPELKILHDGINGLEKDGGTAIAYTTKVPDDYYFFTEDSAGTFNLLFTDIFHMFNLGLLGASLVRIWAMFQAKETRRLKVGICAVADPFHMHGDNTNTEAGRIVSKESLVNTMLGNKEAHFILVPFIIS